MTRVRYRDLTVEQKAAICNGCGAKGNWINPPDWLFKASCDHHDFNYWIGGTETDRKKADYQFYEAMKEDARATSWWRRPFALARAWTYYKAVRIWGTPYFHYGPERTREDLERLIGS